MSLLSMLGLSSLSLGNWLLIVLGLCLVYYFYLRRNFGIWEKKGFHSIPPIAFFGNNKPMLTGEQQSNDFHRDVYDKLKKHKISIFYESSEPQLYVSDVDVIKKVMISDFDHFMDFGFFPSDLAELKANDLGVANTMGERWKQIKGSITPAFSMSNMKNLSTKVNKIALSVVDHLDKRTDQESPVETESLVANFTMDCIAKMCFSMDIGSVANPDNEFCKMGNNFIEIWRFILGMLVPGVAKMFNIGFFNPKSSEYFSQVTKKILKQREAAGNADQFDDILSLMMRAREGKNMGKVEEEKNGFNFTSSGNASHITEDIICKTIMQFFLDGYDTVGSQISITLYFLAVNPEVQERAFEEVEEIHAKCGEDLTGEDVNEMKYLDRVFGESTRLCAVPVTTRRCTKEWEVPGHPGVTIPENFRVVIPIHPLHMDPEHYTDPETFDPDRYSPERKKDIKTGTLMPFGMGPRQCMGMKIAKMESKVFMYNILRKFRIEPSDKTPMTLKGNLRKDHMAKISGGNWLKFVPRD